MIDKIKIALQYLLPQHMLSRLIGMVAQLQAGALTQWWIKKFIAHYRVDMQEALEASPDAYRHFNAFFTRALKPEVRPIAQGEHVHIFPADGVVSQFGHIEHGRLLQAKGRDYSLQTLLGGEREFVSLFADGDFVTIYLSPKDYHRVHMPIAGQLSRMIYVPGQLFSVNQLTSCHVPELFTRNERLVCLFETSTGPMAIVLVGATIVAGIETPWQGRMTPRNPKQLQSWYYYQGTGPKLDKGEEMGRFFLGSTAICIYPKNTVSFDDALAIGAPTKVGEVMAYGVT